MTYCVAMKLDAGLVFLSDTRTNAGVDHVSTFRKMLVFERPGERVLVLLSAGNLALTQAVRQHLVEAREADADTLWTAKSMSDVARVVGQAIRDVYARDAKALEAFGVDFNCSFLLGGQIAGAPSRLFQLYSAGNFIEASSVNPYFQIGESKYGKPIIDRLVTPATSLDDGAKCALISMDSTLRSNVSVGLPLDLLVYEEDSLRVTRFASLDDENVYYKMIHDTWGSRLRQVFDELPEPQWAAVDVSVSALPPPRATPPEGAPGADEASSVQSLAQTFSLKMPG
ncbi:proteasome-type protease [Pandoraea apista]|uniref:Peptidase n=1 Tax=Pandoraea apista TaxID=93218 RepID=A0A0B5FGA8_9BURK|nr:proteasome-type protease [Pandoraea apista]AJE99801.1 peptidase [Pandoraea apista]AKH73934.1 peptidase [Pandoraea apista]AKI62481.1 peptidase [Pandoraea apista]ALS64204.1 peptidase [Pandoraea apista]AVF40737.1 peptidase [Pandoraea apista]